MSDDFRDAVAVAVGVWEEEDGWGGYATDHANSVLAMSEMKLIKSCLLVECIKNAFIWQCSKEDALRRMFLPESVIWWVLQPSAQILHVTADKKEDNYDD